MNDMKKCFGYTECGKSNCAILNIVPSPQVCGECKFFKTKKQLMNDLQNSRESLISRGLVPHRYTDESGTRRMGVREIGVKTNENR